MWHSIKRNIEEIDVRILQKTGMFIHVGFRKRGNKHQSIVPNSFIAFDLIKERNQEIIIEIIIKTDKERKYKFEQIETHAIR
jgi:hypothetical protein